MPASMRRAAGAAAAVVAVVLAAAGCGPDRSDAASAPHSASAKATPAASASPTHAAAKPSAKPSAKPAGDAAKTAPGRPVSGPAAAALEKLAVRPAGTMDGYDRDAFGTAWTDGNDDPYGHNGCDTRDDVLKLDLANIAYRSGTCIVASGTLADPYTGKSIAFHRGAGTSTAVQIDHVAALADAWRTGARSLSVRARTNLANDPLNLLAVDGPANESKSDRDASQWLPPAASFRCDYVARQIAVKAKYGLWVTSAEKAAMKRVLTSCPSQSVPAESTRPPHAHRPAAAPRQATPTHRPAVRHSEPAVAPGGGATAKCRDGSLSFSHHHRGTCSRHHGVAVWYK